MLSIGMLIRRLLMDWKIKAFIKFAEMIKPGWRANCLANVLLLPLKLIGPRRKVAEKNIELVFPEKTPAERKRILYKSYDNMVWTGIEMLAWQKDPSMIDKWVAEVEGRENIEKAFAEGRGIIVLSAHVGNWEHAAAWIGRNYKAFGVVRHSDSQFQKELINTLRETSGLRILGKEEPMVRALGILRRNEMLGLLSDQHGGKEGIEVPFFGQNTSTVQGAAVFAWLTGAPVIPVQGLRLAPFRFKIIIGQPIKWEKGPDRAACIRKLTELANKELEKMIRRAPEQWLWQHRRFRELIPG